RIVQRIGALRAASYLSASDNARRASAGAAKAADTAVGFASAPDSAKIGQAQANLGANTVSEVWAYQGSRPVIADGRLFSAQNELRQCLDLKDGRPVWALRLPVDRDRARALTPPSLAGGRLYFGTGRGEIA